MIRYKLRKIIDGTGLLFLRLSVRRKKIDTDISLKIKMPVKDWANETQLPKNIYDKRPRADLGGMSYAQLAEMLMKIKRLLIAAEQDGTLNMELARKIIHNVISGEVADDVSKADQVPDVFQMPDAYLEPQPQQRKQTFMEFVEQYISECESGERTKTRSTKRMASSTLKRYRGVQEQLKEYQKKRHCVIDWDDITLDFYDDLKQFFIRKDYSPNTIALTIKVLKTFLYAARDMHLTTREDFTSRKFSADWEQVDNIYITQERLDEMADFDMSSYRKMKIRAEKYAKDDEERKTLLHALRRDVYRRSLSEARDVFVMGCLTGQRVSDYKRINADMVETIVGDRKFLHLVQLKTGKDVYVPYFDTMKRILDRYDGELPHVYEQHLNERIKVVGLLLGWTEPAGLTEHKGLMEYASEKRFCDAIKTHTARRTFATNAYKAGVPLSAIIAVTGHSSEEMLKRYLKLGSKERGLLAAEEFDKVHKAM
ncbi:MAG: site-specific integrase [Prevotella sp.]|nr:site-specific integrase [Prevotella sp.]